jgi:copper(I)-binding protein
VRYRLIWTATLLTLLILVTACGSDGDANNDNDELLEIESTGISIRDAWIRQAVLPQGSPTPDPEHAHDPDQRSGVISAMYMVIENPDAQSVQLVSIETNVARIVELHETQNQNGMLRMRPVESVEVPAGGSVIFEPGGLHAMLIDINQPLEPGDEVAVTLVFNTGERLELPSVPVQQS